jgi:hypothetical protein
MFSLEQSLLRPLFATTLTKVGSDASVEHGNLCSLIFLPPSSLAGPKITSKSYHHAHVAQMACKGLKALMSLVNCRIQPLKQPLYISVIIDKDSLSRR